MRTVYYRLGSAGHADVNTFFIFHLFSQWLVMIWHMRDSIEKKSAWKSKKMYINFFFKFCFGGLEKKKKVLWTPRHDRPISACNNRKGRHFQIPPRVLFFYRESSPTSWIEPNLLSFFPPRHYSAIFLHIVNDV